MKELNISFAHKKQNVVNGEFYASIIEDRLINIGTLNTKNDNNEFSKKERIKDIFDEDKALDMLICVETNISS